jgi:hypothetical protein
MRRLLPLFMILSAGTFLAFFAGCSKQSEDKLAPPVPCDTVNVSYGTQIVAILQENCYPCHGNGSTGGSGGINLNTFVNLKFYADNGYLVGNVTHASGYPGMPYGKPPLPKCEIETIVAWVHQGARNN